MDGRLVYMAIYDAVERMKIKGSHLGLGFL